MNVTSTDADARAHSSYFACLAFKFLDDPHRYERFWQPAVVFWLCAGWVWILDGVLWTLVWERADRRCTLRWMIRAVQRAKPPCLPAQSDVVKNEEGVVGLV